MIDLVCIKKYDELLWIKSQKLLSPVERRIKKQKMSYEELVKYIKIISLIFIKHRNVSVFALTDRMVYLRKTSLDKYGTNKLKDSNVEVVFTLVNTSFKNYKLMCHTVNPFM